MEIGIAAIAGAVISWVLTVISWKQHGNAPVTGEEELSAAYSRGCNDCRSGVRR